MKSLANKSETDVQRHRHVNTLFLPISFQYLGCDEKILLFSKVNFMCVMCIQRSIYFASQEIHIKTTRNGFCTRLIENYVMKFLSYFKNTNTSFKWGERKMKILSLCSIPTKTFVITHDNVIKDANLFCHSIKFCVV